MNQHRWRAAALAAATALTACGTAPTKPPTESAAEAKGSAAAPQNRAQQADDAAMRAVLVKQREAALIELTSEADVARRAGKIDEARNLLLRIEALSPEDPRTTWLRNELARSGRHRKLLAEARSAYENQLWDRAESAARTVLEENPGEPSARALLTQLSERQAAQGREEPVFMPGKKPVSLEFHEASLRNVFDALAQAGGANFVFDKDVRGDSKVSLIMKDATVDDALRMVLATQQLDRKLINENSLLIYPNNAQKQRDYQETVTRSFYLVSADAKQTQALLKTMTKTKDMHVDERLNMLIVRDTPEVMRLVERLVEAVDLPEPEVMLDVEVIEISSDLLREIGLTWPTTVSYGLLPVDSGGTTTDTFITKADRGNLRTYVANPLVTARLNGTSGTTNLLASPRIRARNHEKAHVQLGNKLPVFTTTTTGAGSVSGFIASSVSYLDVGLKLDVEPSVMLDNDVALKLSLEVSSVASQVQGPDGSTAYNVGTRQTSTSLRLKDGETEVLAGLIEDDDRRTAAGVPGLSEVPFLGTLFGVRSTQHDKTEVVMLITPHILRNVALPPVAAMSIYSGTDAQPGASSLRSRNNSAKLQVLPSKGGNLPPQMMSSPESVSVPEDAREPPAAPPTGSPATAPGTSPTMPATPTAPAKL